MRIWIENASAVCLALMLGLVCCGAGLSGAAQAQTSIPQKVAADCAADINKYCKAITPGGGRVVACLFAHNDKIAGQCAWSMYDASQALTATMASLRQLARRTSCRSDLAAYCKGIPAGGGRLYQCLRRNRATLTDQCRKTLPKAAELLRRAGMLK